MHRAVILNVFFNALLYWTYSPPRCCSECETVRSKRGSKMALRSAQGVGGVTFLICIGKQSDVPGSVHFFVDHFRILLFHGRGNHVTSENNKHA